MLTTPVIKDEDIVFPGEGWFLYWKTSASLWESKLSGFKDFNRILIPINWSFHTDTGDRIDFAKEKPETDLAKLYEICKGLGKEVVFLMPLTPVPYLANGGVPFLMAKNQVLDQSKRCMVVSDAEGNLCKTYSYFDPRIYTAFTKFCHAFDEYLSHSGINAAVWGMECGHVEAGRFVSYLEDYSQAFEQGFSKYLSTKKDDGDKEFSAQEIEFLKIEYLEVIKNLYIEGARDRITSSWQGVKRIGFILGSSTDIFSRSIDHISDVKIIDEALELFSNGVLPSSILIPNRQKIGIYAHFKTLALSREFVEQSYNERTLNSGLTSYFQTSSMLKIFYQEYGVDKERFAKESGFLDYCRDNFCWDYSLGDIKDLSWEQELESGHDFFYFSGADLDIKSLSNALRMFMNGLNIFIDKRGLKSELVRRLESFYIENELEMEKIRYLTHIETISMGTGRLFIFNSDDLIELEQEKRAQFWNKVFQSLEVDYFEIEKETGLKYLWFERQASSNELTFEKVKRLSVFNPSSYKKKMKFKFPSTHVLRKVIDESNVTVSNATHEVEINFLPKGSVSFDFGVISK